MRRGSRRRRGLTPVPLLGALLLGACTLTPPPRLGPAPPPAVHIAAVQGMVRWVLTGRIGIRVGDRAWSGSLRWAQDGHRYRIRFVGPLGQGSLDLRGAPGAVVLRTSRGGPYRARSASELLEREFGWRLPVQALAYWVRGVPEPGVAYRLHMGPDGRIRGFVQAGWTLAVSDYRRVRRLELPRRVQAHRGTMSVRLAVGRWGLPPAGAGAAPALSD